MSIVAPRSEAAKQRGACDSHIAWADGISAKSMPIDNVEFAP